MTEDASDLSSHELEDRLIESLKSRDGVATAGDVATDTGLPYDTVEGTLDQMLKRYKSHLDVDDAGNLRYRFDPSFPERGEQPGRWWHETKKMAWKAFVWFFKVWTMVMLVGYTITFVLILVALSVAALTAGEDEGGGDLVVLPFYLLARVLETLFWIDLFSHGGLGRRAQRMRRKRRVEKPSEPFYQKIFNYLFGPDAESSSDPLATQKAFTSFVRHRDGRVTAAEWASRSGQSLDAADNALTAGIMRFNGDVDITEEGSLVYRFDRLQVTADSEEDEGDPPAIWNRKLSLPPLTGNKGSTNVWISVLNGFNLLMSSFVVFGASSAMHMGIQIGLGYIPFVFSALFFLLPLMRKLRRSWRQTTVERENRRRNALETVFRSAQRGEARTLEERALPEEFADDFVIEYEGDMDVTDEGTVEYAFPEIARQYEAAREARQAGRGEVVFGETIFSSDEEEKSLEESEMDDFDERLSRELGEEVTLGDLEEEVAESPSASEYVQVK